MPKVSICIPTYNQTVFLRRNIESILVQNFTDYEVVITDDSTTNEVENLIKSYDFNGRLVYKKNLKRLGSPDNWNESISVAKGEYIKILHHDDWFTKVESLRSFVSAIESSKSCMFAFSFSTTYFQNIFRKIHTFDQSKLNLLHSQPERLVVANYIGGPSAVIFRKSLNIKFDNSLKWLVDVDFYISCIKKSPTIYCIEDSLIATMAWEDHQITRQYEKDKNLELLEYFYMFDKHIKSLTSPLRFFFIPTYQKLFVLNSISRTSLTGSEKNLISENDFLEKIFDISIAKKSRILIEQYIKKMGKRLIIYFFASKNVRFKP